MTLRTLGSLLLFAAGCRAHADRAVPPDDPAPTPTADAAPPSEPAAEPTPPPAVEAPPPSEPPPPEPVAEPPAPPPGPPPLVEGANVTVDSIAADGLELRELACAVDGGMPLFGTLAIAGTLAKQKKSIDRCAPKGQAFVVTWTFAAGKVKSPTARGGTAAQNACIAKAFTRAAAPLDGRCGAVVLAGDPTHAATTVDAARATE